jgi:hypothetical protein
MTLRQEQSQFALKVALLILHAKDLGYEVTLGDAYRDPRLHGAMGVKLGYGAAYSFHKQRKAIDLNLYKNGVYLEATEKHRPLGEWWEQQGGTWGGRFKTPDGNHYSWGEGRG